MDKRFLTDEEIGFGQELEGAAQPAKPKLLSDSDIGFEAPDGPLARGWNKAKQSMSVTSQLASGDAAGAAQTIQQAEHEDKLRAIQDSKRQLYERYALGEIDLETYRSQKAVYDAELVQAKNVHAAITAQTKQIQSDYEARLKQREIVQEVGSTDVLTQSLIDRLINRVYVFPGDRIEIEYVTQDFLGTEKSGKEA